jgi:polyisoprenyl-phosphate glycosyltransferase
MMTEASRLTIVMPVFNDWESAATLLGDIEEALAGSGLAIDVLMVDDCSLEPPPAQFAAGPLIARVDCLRLAANVGHQRAIAIGLAEVAQHAASGLVAVMDCDGEDRPVELRRLVEMAGGDSGRVYVAQRAQRSESGLFRLYYRLYVALFRLLTGQRINFGNFAVLPAPFMRRIINDPNVWNNFPAAVVRSRLPVTYVPTRRGKRYFGQSRMNFVSLVAHGLGAISVFSEAVFVRILVFSSMLLGLSIALGGGALYVKLFTDMALPNWATTVLGFALVISIQALMMPILMAFMLLNARSTIQPLPATMILQLVAERLEIPLTAR